MLVVFCKGRQQILLDGCGKNDESNASIPELIWLASYNSCQNPTTHRLTARAPKLM